MRLLLLALSFSTLLSAQNTFEGIVRQTARINGNPAEITWYFKKGKLAIESSFPIEGGFLIVRMIPNVVNQTAIIKTDGAKGKNEYHVTVKEIAAPASMDLASMNAEPTNKGVKVTATNAICYAEVQEDIDVDLSYYNGFFQGNYAILGMTQLGMKGFPVTHSTTDKTGKVVESATLKSVEVVAVDDKEFE